MDEPRILRLGPEDQHTLVGVLLHMMDADLRREEDSDKERGRGGIRNQLRYLTRSQFPDEKPGHAPLDVEERSLLLRRLKEVESEAHAIQLILEAAVFQPWMTQN